MDVAMSRTRKQFSAGSHDAGEAVAAMPLEMGVAERYRNVGNQGGAMPAFGIPIASS